jgi:release factor glutamine methyltransferase
MKGEEATVQLAALLLKHTNGDIDAGIAKLTDATPTNLGKLIKAAHNDTTDTAADDKVGTGGRLAIVGAGFETDIEGRFREQVLVFGTDRGKGIDLGMPLTATNVVALANDSACRGLAVGNNGWAVGNNGWAVDDSGSNDNGSDHRIGLGVLTPANGQLEAAAHKFLVFVTIHGAKIRTLFEFLLSLHTKSHRNKMTYHHLLTKLRGVYDDREAQAVARLVMEQGFGLTLAEALCGHEMDDTRLNTILERLLKGEPVQYVLGRAEFGPHTFHVAPGVLIPRPETYELCQWVIETEGGRRKTEEHFNILDIGTGSGCIACTLAAAMPQARVTAWDISEEALRIAAGNVQRTGTDVAFSRVDILSDDRPTDTGFDIIVSNPPYICQQEQAAMEARVLNHEPHQALFVPDDDALLFYRAIAGYGQAGLKPDGWLYFEINPLYANDLQQMLSTMAYHHIEMKEDQYGKQRMVRAQR